MFEMSAVVIAWVIIPMIIQGTAIGTASETLFTAEPGNMTVIEGESVKLNCSIAGMSDTIAIWVISEVEFYWSDFSSIQLYTFDLRDNSLTVNNSPRSLDGTSFQCVLGVHESQIGYLKVLYLSPSTSSSVSNSQNSNSKSHYSTAGVLHTEDSLALSTFSWSSNNSTTTGTESTTSTLQNSVVIAYTGGAITFCVVILFCLVPLCVLWLRMKKLKLDVNKTSVASAESNELKDFNMDENVLYIERQINDIKTTRSPVYNYPHQFSKSP